MCNYYQRLTRSFPSNHCLLIVSKEAVIKHPLVNSCDLNRRKKNNLQVQIYTVKWSQAAKFCLSVNVKSNVRHQKVPLDSKFWLNKSLRGNKDGQN